MLSEWEISPYMLISSPREREDHCKRAYLSSIQHKRLDLPIGLSMIHLKWPWADLSRVFETNSSVTSTSKNNPQVAYYYSMVFYVGQMRGMLYTIIPNLPIGLLLIHLQWPWRTNGGSLKLILVSNQLQKVIPSCILLFHGFFIGQN